MRHRRQTLKASAWTVRRTRRREFPGKAFQVKTVQHKVCSHSRVMTAACFWRGSAVHTHCIATAEVSGTKTSNPGRTQPKPRCAHVPRTFVGEQFIPDYSHLSDLHTTKQVRSTQETDNPSQTSVTRTGFTVTTRNGFFFFIPQTWMLICWLFFFLFFFLKP